MAPNRVSYAQLLHQKSLEVEQGHVELVVDAEYNSWVTDLANDLAEEFPQLNFEPWDGPKAVWPKIFVEEKK